MNRPELECLSAMIDGETVDSNAVARALEAPGGVEALVDFLDLRRELRSGVETPSSASDPGAPSRSPAARRRRWLEGAALAAALAAVLAVAVLAPLAWFDRPAETAAPAEGVPEADRVLRFEPGRDWSG